MALCSNAKTWMVPTLEASEEATLIISADTGIVLHRNSSAKHQGVSSENINDMGTFEGEKDWAQIQCDIKSNESYATHMKSGNKGLSMRLTKLDTCACGCGETYVLAHVSAADESSLTTTLAHLEATIDGSFDAMFTIDQDGIILMTNQAAVKIFGYDSKQDFLGHNISMICGGEHKANHDEYLKRYLATGVTKIMGKKRTVNAQRRDGSEFHVELGIVELPRLGKDGKRLFSAFIFDLSVAEQYEVELHDKEILTQAMVNASFDPMFQTDQKGVIIVVNEAALSLFGYNREEMIGANVSVLCGDGHGPKHDLYMGRYLKTGEKRIIGRKRITVAKRKDGSEFEIELAIQEVRKDDGELAFCGYIRDMTSLNLLKESVQRQGDLIQNAFFQTGAQPHGDSGRRRRPRSRRSKTLD